MNQQNNRNRLEPAQWGRWLKRIALGTLGGGIIFLLALQIRTPTQKKASILPAAELIITGSDNLPPKSWKSERTIAEVKNVPTGVFNYGGSICFAALFREGLKEEIEKNHPQFQLRYIEPQGQPGCTAEIEPLLEKKLSFAHNAHSLTTEEYQWALERGLALESIPIALDGVIVYAHKSLGVKSLTLKQLQEIYRGKITNWQEVGGKNLPITVVSLEPKNNTDVHLLMGRTNNLALGEAVKIVRDYTSAIREVSITPGAISLGSTAILKGQNSIKSLALAESAQSLPVAALLADGKVNLQAFAQKSYPLTRRLFINIRRDGTVAEQAGVAYTNFLISQQGQEIVKQAGYVPLYRD